MLGNIFHSFSIPFTFSPPDKSHFLTQGILFISCPHHPVTFVLLNLLLFLFISGFLFSSPLSHSISAFTCLVSSHVLFSPSSLSLSLPPTSPCLAIMFVLEIELSFLPVISGYASSDTHAHTCTPAHAPAEECSSLLHPPSCLPHSFLQHFLTYSPPPSCSAHRLHFSLHRFLFFLSALFSVTAD